MPKKAPAKDEVAGEPGVSQSNTTQLYDFLSVFEMKNVVELLSMYIEINKKLLDEEKRSCKVFKRFTELLVDFNDIL